MTPVHIRMAIRRDLPEMLEIELQSFHQAWGEEDFVRCLRQRNCMGMVAEVIERPYPEPIAGFMIYELHRRKLELLNFAVHPAWRRQGVGFQMVQKLKSKLGARNRNRIGAMVRETNLSAQLFFKAQGFTATRVDPGFYEDSGEDAYRFVHRVYAPEPELGVSG